MSDSWTIVKEIKDRLTSAVWSGVGGEAVFGNVLVSAGVDMEKVAGQLRWPFVLLLPDTMEVDDEEPDLVTARFTVLVAQRVAGDAWGESCLIGGAGPGTGLTSLGRGLMELEGILFNEIKLLGPTLGVTLQFIAASAIAADLDPDNGYVAQRQYTFEAWTGAGDTTSYPIASAPSIPPGF